MGRERRDAERIEDRNLVGLFVGEAPMALYELVDISRSGVRIRLGELVLAQGQEVRVELEVDGDSFEFGARTAHLTEGEAGLEFIDVTEDDGALIEAFVIDKGWGLLPIT